MDSDIKSRLFDNIHERVIKRKAMFIPFLCVSTFALVGYAAADKEAPVIESRKVEVLYGTTLDKDVFKISDNRDSVDALDIQIDTSSFDSTQLGTYSVPVTATDMFSNTATKNVLVEVVDKSAPVLSTVSKSNGYAISIEVNSSNDIKKYIKAADNVDGDVSAFIVTDKKLNTSKLGAQTIEVSVDDNAGNTTKETYEFFVSDNTAPTIKLNKGANITVDYGKSFNYKDYVTISDNFDKKVSDVKVEGKVDVKKEGKYDLKITGTDSSNNKTTKTLTVNVDDISAPKVTLSKKKVSLEKGKSFDAKKYLKSAVDNKDGNVKSDVKISSSVNTKKVGNYTVTYTVKDSSGNTSKATLKVEVTKPYDVASNLGIVTTAKTRLGCPYKWGATGPTKFDCSGFTQWVYRKNGKSIPRTSGAQKSGGRVVSLSNVRPGDIVWRPGHVGIYVGNGTVIHAPHTGAVVSYTRLSGFTCGVRY